MMGLISLAPQKPAATTSTAADSQEEKPISEVMKKLREALERLKVRVSEGEFEYEEQVGVHGERLMPMATSKTNIVMNPGRRCYDDEYDDGYEQKEFTVEPLNAQTSSDESEGESTEEPAVGDAGKPRGGGRGRQYRNTTRAPVNTSAGK
ncbi:hypothetical protein TELCIR_18463 [Teladorsagia circumcincta]|uniref:Uncharacterized protein n=1 Tax=Teladorsagia circumcincta TaxID=45464 RepID=A0A2G9TQ42_TELCI|nr:hypothetical protein TELCIR_18463 [Teladorsagia circumcincta]